MNIVLSVLKTEEYFLKQFHGNHKSQDHSAQINLWKILTDVWVRDFYFFSALYGKGFTVLARNFQQNPKTWSELWLTGSFKKFIGDVI